MKNPFVNLYEVVENHVLKTVDFNKLRVAAVSRDKAPSQSLEREAVTLQAQTLAEWKSAVAMATDPDNPDRSYLQRLYDNLLLDNHLASVIDSRILFCQRSPFKIVNEKGEENAELSWLFERTWFEDFVKNTLMARFVGNTLQELYFLDEITKELRQIDTIPMAYYNPKKGIITKSAGDATGWLYKEGALASYYIQSGKDEDLGLLAQMAPIVLAKKLGLGSWLDYVEKYGVPSLFITTDREDDNRLNQLFQAAQNFKSNGFMVGRGNEKFEVGKDASGGNPDNFDKLIERANTEISKRILGGAGITDEKAYVGSSEIQFRLTKDRFESDKLLVKNVINQNLFPRLLKLSPVYAPLANHYFDWDNTENQTQEQITNMVNTLSANFELDLEEVSQRTGFKILGQKNNGMTPATPPETEADKKKKRDNQVSAIFNAITQSYHADDCGCGDCTTIVAIDFSRYTKIIDRIAKALHDKELKPEELDQEFITQTYNELSEGAADGYGKNWNQFPKDGKGSTPQYLKRNIYAFSGAKSYAVLKQLNDLLVDADGKLRPFNEFQQIARKINENFNKNYLQAEYQTARTAAQMAEKWERLQETKDFFPNLKFRTVGDDRVRDDHARLDGIIKPIDDSFWSRYYPPLDWRCRCDVVATAEDADTKEPKDLPPVKFKGNVGKDKEIFTKKGTFFQLLKTDESAKRNAELSKLVAPNEVYYRKNGKKIEVSIFKDDSDFEDNYKSAKRLVDEYGLNILIRPHLNGRYVKDKPNPEYLINGKIADRKAPESNNYKKTLKKANDQECEIVVFDLSVNGDTIENALKKISTILSKDVHPFIKEIYIISNNGKEIKHYKRKKRTNK